MIESLLDVVPIVVHLDVAEIEEEHSSCRVVDAGIDNLRHKTALTAVLEACRVAYVRTTDVRDISCKDVLGSLAETLHSPFVAAVDRLGRSIGTDDHYIAMVSIAITAVLRCSPSVSALCIVARTCPVDSRIKVA